MELLASRTKKYKILKPLQDVGDKKHVLNMFQGTISIYYMSIVCLPYSFSGRTFSPFGSPLLCFVGSKLLSLSGNMHRLPLHRWCCNIHILNSEWWMDSCNSISYPFDIIETCFWEIFSNITIIRGILVFPPFSTSSKYNIAQGTFSTWCGVFGLPLLLVNVFDLHDPPGKVSDGSGSRTHCGGNGKRPLHGPSRLWKWLLMSMCLLEAWWSNYIIFWSSSTKRSKHVQIVFQVQFEFKCSLSMLQSRIYRMYLNMYCNMIFVHVSSSGFWKYVCVCVYSYIHSIDIFTYRVLVTSNVIGRIGGLYFIAKSF